MTMMRTRTAEGRNAEGRRVEDEALCSGGCGWAKDRCVCVSRFNWGKR